MLVYTIESYVQKMTDIKVFSSPFYWLAVLQSPSLS